MGFKPLGCVYMIHWGVGIAFFDMKGCMACVVDQEQKYITIQTTTTIK